MIRVFAAGFILYVLTIVSITALREAKQKEITATVVNLVPNKK